MSTVRRPTTTRHLEMLVAMAGGEHPLPPIATLVGFTFAEFDLGHAVTEMEAGPRHANPMGTLHGGIVCDLADAAMGTAMATTLEDDESFTTIDLGAKFLKPVRSARLRATADVVKRTRTLGLVECSVVDETGSLVARLDSTCLVLRGEDARGRSAISGG
jgi:uncharacterized protein (TIGR00369 family)